MLVEAIPQNHKLYKQHTIHLQKHVDKSYTSESQTEVNKPTIWTSKKAIFQLFFLIIVEKQTAICYKRRGEIDLTR